MKTSEKSEKPRDSRPRDSSPRPQVQPKPKRRTLPKTQPNIFTDPPEVDRVKRYFVGKELQKVWQKVSYSGRQRIVRHYAAVSIIISEMETEEPLPGEDESIPCYSMEEDADYSGGIFEFRTVLSPDSKPLEIGLCTSPHDFTELLTDPPSLLPPDQHSAFEFTLEVASLVLVRPLEPDFDFYEFICDDTWSKVGLSEPGCSNYSAILQGKLDQANDAQGDKDEQHAEAPGSHGLEAKTEANGLEGRRRQLLGQKGRLTLPGDDRRVFLRPS
jgi:hypothetical protein